MRRVMEFQPMKTNHRSFSFFEPLDKFGVAICAFLIVAGFIFPISVSAQDRPNIIFMMSDDQGWDGTSVQMHPDLKNSGNAIVSTPNLEKLASQGMRFSAAYSPASVCSPTRLSLMNGKSPAANHLSLIHI